jgi:acrylyl-CoA reductase (NADPH)
MTDGDVEVNVSLSALGRSDALIARGAGPAGAAGLVLGSDLVGVVTGSRDDRWRVGDRVLATGHGLGRTHHGGWCERARVPGDWLLRLPDGLAPQQAMIIGSAGLAAMQAVLALDYHGVLPEAGPIVVTGATGGVGSLAIVALCDFGFRVTAATRRPEAFEYLIALGAANVIAWAELRAGDGLGPERWAGGIDCLGGETLAALVSTTCRGGAVISVGSAAGVATTVSLAGFTDRAVAVLGVDAVNAVRSRRTEAWERWAECGGLSKLDFLSALLPLDDVPEAARRLLEGEFRGRLVVDVTGASLRADRLH